MVIKFALKTAIGIKSSPAYDQYQPWYVTHREDGNDTGENNGEVELLLADVIFVSNF